MAGLTTMLHNLRQKSNEEKCGIDTTATLVDQWEGRGIRLVRLVYSDGIVKGWQVEKDGHLYKFRTEQEARDYLRSSCGIYTAPYTPTGLY